MRVFFCDHFEVPLPDGHRFPMIKYRMLRDALVAQGVLSSSSVIAAEPATAADLCIAHDEGYVAGMLAGTLSADVIRRIGFPWSPEYAARSLASVGGTLMAVDAALEDGIAGNLAGGTHHAHREFGAGYCAFNDLAIAALRLLDRGRARRVLIFDTDVHQGDGTAAIFADDERVFTTSIHGEKNFPLRKQHSDLDVALPDGTSDEAFLSAVRDALATSLDRARPDVVLVQAGVDALADDRLGRLAVTLDGLRARDEHVFGELRCRGLPTVVTIGGGYAEPIDLTVEAHVQTYAAAAAP